MEKYAEFVDSLNLTKNTYYDMSHHILSLASEAGEVAGHYSKHMRHMTGSEYSELMDLSFEADSHIVSELGDVLFHLQALCNIYGLSLEDLKDNNMKKLQDRKKRGVLIGNGDNR